jgi:asparaginyl-tRNA synthetase
MPEIDIANVSKYVSGCVVLNGWIHRIRRQGKKMAFIILRDGTGYIQVGLFGSILTDNNELLNQEAYIRVMGKVKADARAPGGYEVECEELTIRGKSANDWENSAPIDANQQLVFDNRHLYLRGENTGAIFRIRTFLIRTFREFYENHNYTEITPPSMVNNACEGGSTLFKLNYFGEDGYLTQSSQLYLESVVPAFGRVFCIHPSFRAERSRTRRHLSEYTHIEMESHNMSLPKLIDHLKKLFDFIFHKIDENPAIKELVLKLNAKYRPLFEDDFIILPYYKAIELCSELQLQFIDTDAAADDKGRPYQYGDDLTDKVERQICEHLGKPIFITQFPSHMKAFYMEPLETERGIETNSCDLLFPGVGEVVGGSMRNSDYSDLMEKINKEGIPVENYKWYLDLRKYGAGHTGGYGIGTERILLYILGGDASEYSVKDCCLYPRYMGRMSP